MTKNREMQPIRCKVLRVECKHSDRAAHDSVRVRSTGWVGETCLSERTKGPEGQSVGALTKYWARKG
jgi:hypothetical protein